MCHSIALQGLQTILCTHALDGDPPNLVEMHGAHILGMAHSVAPHRIIPLLGGEESEWVHHHLQWVVSAKGRQGLQCRGLSGLVRPESDSFGIK
jgi:hypothetical protein